MADTEVKKELVFTKEQLAASKKYADHVDLLNALLTDGESYTFKQADDMISAYLKKEVK